MSLHNRTKRRHIVESDSEYSPILSEDSEDGGDSNIDDLRKTNKKAYYNFIDIKKEISRTEPNIIIILTEPLLQSDRVNLLQLYEIYKLCEPNTEQWLELRNNFIKVFIECQKNYIQYSKYTLEEHRQMNLQVELVSTVSSCSELKYKILNLETCIENKAVIYARYMEMVSMSSNDDERCKLQNWLNWCICIPHDKIKMFPFSNSELTVFLRGVSEVLDRELYGMKNVKEQILLFVSSKIQNPHMKRCSLGLVGSPGTGKTAIARLLASVLQFPFEQISLGGVSGSEFLKGHQYTYIGAHAGEIVKCLRRMKYKNGILFLDEVDKISNNKDVCSALLHITDPLQNSDFRDNFLSDITIDLSYIWFIYSMNELPSDSALSDRIYTIDVPSYELDDKICIIIDYLIPKALKNINIPVGSIVLSKPVAKYVVEKVCTKPPVGRSQDVPSGVRSIEKIVSNIVSKIDFAVRHQDKDGILYGFNLSFNMNMFIKYPIKLTKCMIDILV